MTRYASRIGTKVGGRLRPTRELYVNPDTCVSLYRGQSAAVDIVLDRGG